MVEKNLFEIATREKYRFVYKGTVTIEDLWDISLSGLDSIYKALNAEAKKSQEESLLTQKTKDEETILNKIGIVRHVFSEKMAEKAKAERALKNLQQRKRILEVIADKEDASLKDKSIEELKAMASALEDDGR